MKKRILIVDDEPPIREAVSDILEDEGYEHIEASDGETALELVSNSLPDLVLLDIWLPGMDGLEVLKHMREEWPFIPVVVMSGHGTIETAVKATKLGAYDFIEKPLSYEQLILTIQNALRLKDLQEQNVLLREKTGGEKELIGEGPAMQRLKEQIRLIAPTDAWVLIQGENGTGKELVAQTIHRLSKRADKPLVEVNCAAIPDELIESELFGHEKGAFTGATSMKRGKFDLANGGTLFLDEIGDMSLKTQAKILRIIQEQRFERVGGSKTIAVDVRILAATNKDLEEEIKAGRFREDLYFRLNVIPVVVPPLRERKEDIGLLATHFLEEYATRIGCGIKRLSPEVIEALKGYSWPGNVRELKNLIERLVILSRGETITVEDLPPPFRTISAAGAQGPRGTVPRWLDCPNFKEAKALFEKAYLERKLKEFGGNVKRTAEAIGIAPRHLHRKIKDLSITVGEE